MCHYLTKFLGLHASLFSSLYHTHNTRSRAHTHFEQCMRYTTSFFNYLINVYFPDIFDHDFISTFV